MASVFVLRSRSERFPSPEYHGARRVEFGHLPMGNPGCLSIHESLGQDLEGRLGRANGRREGDPSLHRGCGRALQRGHGGGCAEAGQCEHPADMRISRRGVGPLFVHLGFDGRDGRGFDQRRVPKRSIRRNADRHPSGCEAPPGSRQVAGPKTSKVGFDLETR